MESHPPHLEPTLHSGHPPTPFLVVLDERENSEDFYKKCAGRGISLRKLSNYTFVLFSFDSVDYTCQYLKQIGSPSFPVALVELGAYYDIK